MSFRRAAVDRHSSPVSEYGVNSGWNPAPALRGSWLNLIEPYIPAISVGGSPGEVIHEQDIFGFKLLHYRSIRAHPDKKLLIIPHIVNRPYILDLRPDISVVERFCKDGFDVFMIDYGYSGSCHPEISFRDYVDYVGHAADLISTTGTGILGYCTGGVISLCYAGLHPDKVENLILLATPVDYSMLEDPRIFAVRSFDLTPLGEILGNVPGEFINYFGFTMLALYFPIFSTSAEFLTEYTDRMYTAQAWRVARWLCDAPAVPRRAYSDYINGCYRDNLLIKGKFRLGPDLVALDRVKCPIMNIAARYDHLVPEASVTALRKVYTGREYRQIIFASSHIGLSIGRKAHRELWPLVSGWAK